MRDSAQGGCGIFPALSSNETLLAISIAHNWGRDLKIHESVRIFEIGAHLAKCAMRFQKLSPRFSVPVKSDIPGTGGLELVSVSRQEPTSAKSQLGKRPKDP